MRSKHEVANGYELPAANADFVGFGEIDFPTRTFFAIGWWVDCRKDPPMDYDFDPRRPPPPPRRLDARQAARLHRACSPPPAASATACHHRRASRCRRTAPMRCAATRPGPTSPARGTPRSAPAWRRSTTRRSSAAMHGRLEDVWYQGEVVGQRFVRNDKLLMFMLAEPRDDGQPQLSRAAACPTRRPSVDEVFAAALAQFEKGIAAAAGPRPRPRRRRPPPPRDDFTPPRVRNVRFRAPASGRRRSTPARPSRRRSGTRRTARSRSG